MINTLWLRTFCTLVDMGHFTRTAERLYMTQSGVSQHIMKLEEQLGTALILREGKRFSLSQAGQRLYSEAQDILLALNNLEHTIMEDSPHEGVVRIMSPGSVGLKLYPKLLQLQSQHPKLTIEYRFAPNADIDRAIAQSSIDLGFMTARTTLPDVACSPIAEETLLLVTPANVKQPHWQTLMRLGFIHHPDGHHHAQLLLSANYPEFQHCQQFPNKGFSNQIDLILKPVSLGLGFTVLPAHAVEAFHSPHTIKTHSLSHTASEPLYLCHRQNQVLPKRMHTIIDEAKRWLTPTLNTLKPTTNKPKTTAKKPNPKLK